MAPFLFLLLFLSGAASDLIEVTVDPGQDAILSCQAGNSSIRVVEWTRPDLEPDYVLVYRDLNTTHQHPSYKNRVELVDRDLKDGDASLILKNVIRHDAGTYECLVITDDSDPIRSIRTIHLQVSEPAGSPGGLYGGLVAGVLVLVAAAVLGVWMYKRRNNRRSGMLPTEITL